MAGTPPYSIKALSNSWTVSISHMGKLAPQKKTCPTDEDFLFNFRISLGLHPIGIIHGYWRPPPRACLHPPEKEF